MASIRKYKTANGTAWRVQYRSPDGRSRTKQGFPTKAKAESWAAANTTQIDTGAWIDPKAGKTTIDQLAEQWLATQTRLKPTVQRLNESYWRVHIQPQWGRRPASSIRPSEVQQWINNIDRSPSVIKGAHGCLAQILDIAVNDNMIPSNPARLAKLPKKNKAVKVYLTIEQLYRLADESKVYKDLVLLLGTTGLRWGEAIALRPCDFDLLKRRINVTRNATRTSDGFVVGPPKTHEHRTVAITSHALEVLRPRIEATGADALLWHGADGNFLRHAGKESWFEYAVRRCQDSDLTFPRLTPHGLRHVAAGLMVSAGANVKVVQRQLGHASAAMTLDTYADLFDGDLDGVADILEKKLNECRGIVVGLPDKRPSRSSKSAV